MRLGLIKVQLIFSFIVLTVYQSNCLTYYKCGNDLETNQCKAYFNLNYHIDYALVRSCSEGKLCTYQHSETSPLYYCEPVKNLVPGEKCTDNNSCLSKTCSGGLCIGKVQGDECKTHEDCNAGLSCRNSSCKPVIKISSGNKESCLTDYDCENDAGCSQFQCFKYFSKEEHQQSDDGMLCKSGKSIDGECVQLKINQNSFDCIIYNSFCFYNYKNSVGGTFNYHSPCYNRSKIVEGTLYGGYGYCESDSNDMASNVIPVKLKSINLDAHTTKRFDNTKLTLEDFKKSNKFYDDASDCVIQHLENISSAFKESIHFLLLVVLTLGFLI